MSMRASNRARAGRRPGLEVLEERCTPATASGTITGTAFIDGNANGVFNAGERRLPGAPIILSGTTITGTDVRIRAVTDAAGKYKFQNVLPGTYTVTPGNLPGTMKNVPVNLASLVVPATTSNTFSLTRNVGFGGPSPQGFSWRHVLTSPVTTPQFAPTGSGSALANYRANNAPTVVSGGIPTQTLVEDGTRFVDMAAFFTDPDITNSRVRFVVQKFTPGSGFANSFIDVDLFDKDAPQTVANFFNYVTANSYDNTVFHRLATQAAAGGGALQGGGFTFNDLTDTFNSFLTGDEPTVKNEYSALHTNTFNTLSMARTTALDSATSQFFFNTTNNASAFVNYTVFGQIVGSSTAFLSPILSALLSGVQSAQGSLTGVNGAANLGPGFADVPTVGSVEKTFPNPSNPSQNITGQVVPADPSARNFLILKDVQILKRDEWLTYSLVDGSGNNVQELINGSVKATFVNNQLKLTNVNGGGGVATFTVRATDRYGASVTTQVNVAIGSINDAPAGTDNTVTTEEDTPYIFTTDDFGFTDPNDTPPNNFQAVQITTLPVAETGTLTLNNVAVAVGQVISTVDINANLLKFTPAENLNGTAAAAFTFQVQDDGGTSGGGIDLDPTPNVMTINVTAVNDAPVNSVPGAQITTQDTAIAFTGTNAITVSDVDVAETPGGELEVTLVVQHGSLALTGTTAGLTFLDDDGSDGSLTFSGSVAALDAALAGLVYQPGVGFLGFDGLTISTSDLGNTGSGGPKTAEDLIVIEVVL